MKSSYLCLTIALLFGSIFYVTNGAIIGIDLGSKYFKVALVKPGTPFEKGTPTEHGTPFQN